ncbi:MAG: DUF3866 family protein [Bacillota bacterium]
MLATKCGTVSKVIASRAGITEVEVKLEESNQLRKAINYDYLTGEIDLADEVVINTTAVELELGTGGRDFVIANRTFQQQNLVGPGHIMKLRYTPLQLKVCSVEEEASQYRKQIRDFRSLAGQPILVGTLHSMLAPAAIVIDSLVSSQLKIAYIMTDGAALPLQLSRTVAQLQEIGLITTTITVGQAFGGDLEAVNIYSGLIAAKEVVEADITIVAMGPGVVGTGTEFGFSGIEQGEIINAVANLGGVPIAIPRLSFQDSRQRHYGLSHHTLTVLAKIAAKEAVVGLPYLSTTKSRHLKEQLAEFNLTCQHQICYRLGIEGLQLINQSPIQVSTMGRDEVADPEFFMAVGVAAKLAVEKLALS